MPYRPDDETYRPDYHLPGYTNTPKPEPRPCRCWRVLALPVIVAALLLTLDTIGLPA